MKTEAASSPDVGKLLLYAIKYLFNAPGHLYIAACNRAFCSLGAHRVLLVSYDHMSRGIEVGRR